ncbi:MAG TPA: prephenate dehydrogenase/arogenate dehydrogenase family protein [Pusillimonas sp.]|jgi:prephenate dehydrogenase|nr:prephenate dehydrogenase [Pusillimonas sp.]HBT32447.1 prephenate dehydrogenase/arogenate dehydrogenase family protein [Pusillimonas sp.]HCN70342.1 prephenate dehydrogenase/arogenate dehydrogenase family protein [Pusillimonas sp.]HCP78908.1 prephenate dehydrogenase/arogenate dehydrogenase family protein [Pusillimonas sp.]|tara:strand:+ start:7903 stop:8796 length:894 start_codon:yes stop_codon:yes gene_type:complete
MSNFPSSSSIDTLAIVGVGLIGGSFAAALRKAGRVKRVLGVGRRPGPLVQAKQLGLIDEAVSLEEAACEADLILLASPVGAMPALFRGLAPHLKASALVTDAGSTKADVVKAAYEALGDRVGQFIPGHPIAGAEKTGPESADAGLYEGRHVVLTPLPENSAAMRQQLILLWEAVGARIVLMDPHSHDRALASVSHLPHFLASVFMEQVAACTDADLRLGLAGTGFRDFTRVAAGSAEMWRDIFMANREAVLRELGDFRATLDEAESALRDEDAQKLYDMLERAALARRFWGSRSGLL